MIILKVIFWVIATPVLLIIVGVVWLWVLAWIGNTICRGGE